MALVGINDIAEMLGVSRTRADQLSGAPASPSPRSATRACGYGEDTEVQEWIKANRKEPD
jgi:hypothetical protein